ncbi:hypothetical protein QM306_40780, partial [Burkholderia cenocepacia]|nr:hypothetical protein [Burkholderia cenocepacia]
LAAIALFTVAMAVFAVQLRMDAGFEKQMPIGHEYIRTFQQYRNDLLGANRITVVVRAKHGSIWSKQGLTRLYDVTQAVTYLPNCHTSDVSEHATSSTVKRTEWQYQYTASVVSSSATAQKPSTAVA